MTQMLAAPPVSQLQSHCHVFSSLPERYLIELETEGTLRTYRLDEGEAIRLLSSDIGDALFILQGSVLVKRQDGGEEAIGPDSDRCLAISFAAKPVEVTATSPSLLVRAARDQLDYLISWSVMLESLPSDDDQIRNRLTQLRYPAIFMNLPFANVEKAFKRMTVRKVKAGEDIIRQGDPGDNFYIIESGHAEVWQMGAYDDEQKLVAELGPGHHFGDEALVTGGTRNATIRMTEDGTLLVLSKEDFNELISKTMVNEVEPEMAKTLSDRGYQMLDVRYEEEWEDAHIPGAKLIPLHELRKRLNELDPDAKYVTYCLSGKRSAVAALILKQNGLDAVCMKEGLREWAYETESAY